MERIVLKNNEDSNKQLIIKAFYDSKKQLMLQVWLVLWSLCGVAIFSQFFLDYDDGTKLFFGVYIAFWLFFEFKVVYAYRWHKFGVEKIIIENDKIFISKEIGRRGVVSSYDITAFKKVRKIKDKPGAFVSFLSDGYWNVNKYSLELDIEDKKIPFGLDLNEKEQKDLIQKINLLRNK